MNLKLLACCTFFLILFVSCNSQTVVSQDSSPSTAPIFSNLPDPTSIINPTLSPSPGLLQMQETRIAFDPTFASLQRTQDYYMNTEIPATLEARNVKCIDGFSLELGLDVIRMSTENWTVFTCSPRMKNMRDYLTPGVIDFGKRYTEIIKTDLSRSWTINHNTFDYSLINRPDAFLAPYHWSTNGKFLYLYPRYYPSGSGFPQSAFLNTQINSLYRINLDTGKFDLFLKGDEFRALAFSSNDQFLVYSDGDKPSIIHTRNLDTNEDVQIDIQENVVATGAFIWYPDNSKVIFFAGYGKQSEDWQEDLSGTSIFILTPNNMHVQKVLGKDSRIFEPGDCSENNDVWLDENTICLYSSNYESDSWNKYFSFNLKTGVIKFLRSFL